LVLGPAVKYTAGISELVEADLLHTAMREAVGYVLHGTVAKGVGLKPPVGAVGIYPHRKAFVLGIGRGVGAALAVYLQVKCQALVFKISGHGFWPLAHPPSPLWGNRLSNYFEAVFWLTVLVLDFARTDRWFARTDRRFRLCCLSRKHCGFTDYAFYACTLVEAFVA
jgi:hypothetical protein